MDLKKFTHIWKGSAQSLTYVSYAQCTAEICKQKHSEGKRLISYRALPYTFVQSWTSSVRDLAAFYMPAVMAELILVNSNSHNSNCQIIQTGILVLAMWHVYEWCKTLLNSNLKCRPLLIQTRLPICATQSEQESTVHHFSLQLCKPVTMGLFHVNWSTPCSKQLVEIVWLHCTCCCVTSSHTLTGAWSLSFFHGCRCSHSFRTSLLHTTPPPPSARLGHDIISK